MGPLYGFGRLRGGCASQHRLVHGQAMRLDDADIRSDDHARQQREQITRNNGFNRSWTAFPIADERDRIIDGFGQRPDRPLRVGFCGVTDGSIEEDNTHGIGLLRGYALFQTLKNSIAFGIASVPEGLPALATTTLALDIEQMRRRNVLVRRLEAVEAIASARVVCLDKTGTMTLNMTVA
jgi:hypothetical protein